MASLNDKETQALISIKQSALASKSGSGATLVDWAISPFDKSSDPCRWTGISCSADGSTVVSLNISGLDLSHGTLSPAIGRLPNLKVLSLACTSLSGNLPVQITHLTSLRYLNISNNYFNGKFPRNFSRLSFLEVLDASANNFTGELPFEVGVLSKLRHLHLGASFFEGTIPLSYGNLVSRIPYLYFAYNSFTGQIPTELGLLVNLQIMDLQSCNFSGSIPSAISFLVNLNTLFLHNNNLQGPIPQGLGNMTSLKSLDISNNLISGSIPDSICNLTKLELLSLLYNSLSGEIPGCIGDLPELQVLKLFNNNLTGQIPQQLGSSNLQLRQVDLCYNDLQGPIPPHICAGKKLQWLLLISNRLSGQIPNSLSLCISLVRVRLGENQLVGAIPGGLVLLPRLEILELNSNYLRGPALPFIKAMPFPYTSRTLNFAENFLTGSLPSIELMPYWSALQEVDLSRNRLSGSIPSGIGQLSLHLNSLDLSCNFLTGSLPPSLALCSQLSQLNLSRNLLNGSIPSSLQTMTWLTSLDLSFNNLSGYAPLGGPFNESSLLGNAHLIYSCERGPNDLYPALNSCMGSPLVDKERHHHKGLLLYLMQNPLLSTISTKAMVLASTVAGMTLLTTICLLIQIFRQSMCSTEMKVRFQTLAKKSFQSVKPAWRFERYDKLEFTVEDVLGSLKPENIIGQGSSGAVYRALMPCGRVIAVKQIAISSTAMEMKITRKEYQSCSASTNTSDLPAELRILGMVCHRNIVKLLGWCSDGTTHLLLYEYVENGNLHQFIYDRTPSALENGWKTRFNIALGVARGLAYLHYESFPPILHRDVKPSNILIDSRFEAKLADFGLARQLHNSITSSKRSFSCIAGTCGYIAPEYSYTSNVDQKSDVYSYGVVLLELLTGRKPICAEYGEGMDIVKWLPLRCVEEDPASRPTMLEVVKILNYHCSLC
ncbi:hypothetical protein KP509_30G049500 [Ceratopteris richardii]|uniref:non-specific serine/threonine protein kinase n=1 Tax=Ceratopteris richardii TaxID=49495 RepID=A0A8T2R3U5_CERRI|nr:hypothetical protein KP509_30G049500 [Ceratopteris richardii]